MDITSARWPWIDRGLFPTREAVIAWIKRNSRIFVALIIMVLSATLPLQPERYDDYQRRDPQIHDQTTLTTNNPTVTITVSADIS